MDPFQAPQQPICTPSGKPVHGTGTTTSVWIQDWDSYWTIVPKQSPGSASFKQKLYFSLSIPYPSLLHSSKVLGSEKRINKNLDHKHSAHFISKDHEAFSCRIVGQKVQRVPALMGDKGGNRCLFVDNLVHRPLTSTSHTIKFQLSLRQKVLKHVKARCDIDFIRN